jgi:hypothetical protein
MRQGAELASKELARMKGRMLGTTCGRKTSGVCPAGAGMAAPAASLLGKRRNSAWACAATCAKVATVAEIGSLN